MKEEPFFPLTPVADESLEGRIVAWVWDEASPEEAEELSALCEIRPDLQEFQRRMLSLRELLQESEASTDHWKLSPEKRRPIEALYQKSGEASLASVPGKEHRRRWLVPALLGAAACWVLASGFWHLLGSAREPSSVVAAQGQSRPNLSFARKSPEVAAVAFPDEWRPVAEGEFHHEPILPPQLPIAALHSLELSIAPKNLESESLQPKTAFIEENHSAALLAEDSSKYRSSKTIPTDSPASGERREWGDISLSNKFAAQLSEGEIPTVEKPYSTFPLPVPDTSFERASAALQQRVRPNAKSIRVEEFYNAFDYRDTPLPQGEPAACTIETTSHPLAPERHLVRISFKIDPEYEASGTLQVQFNPAEVSHYKLLGFNPSSSHSNPSSEVKSTETPALKGSGTALYQIEMTPNGSGDLGAVSLRLVDPTTHAPLDRNWVIPNPAHDASFEKATPSMKLAVLSMFTAEKLKGGELADAIDFSEFSTHLSDIKHRYPDNVEVKKWVEMMEELQ